MNKMTTSTVVFVTISALSLCSLCSSQDVRFGIYENNQPGELIGNVDESTVRMGLSYFLMTEGSGYEHHFSVDELTGELSAADSLDRESLCEFMIECNLMLEVGVHSRTDDSYFSVIRVVVTVEDVNDNPPRFPQPLVHLPITEAVLTGATFTIEGARDLDTSDKFSLQTYEIIPEQPNEYLPFDLSFSKNLDGSSIVKLKVTQSLNREETDGYNFYIVAKDGGSPPLNGSLYLNITVEDVNDHYPQFEQQSYNVTVREDVTINTTILTLTAFDLDLGINAHVIYRFSTHQPSVNMETFRLDSDTGALRVTKPLSYTTKNSYKLIIEASDNSDVPLITQTFVQVYVLNSGNNPPEIYVNTLPFNEFAEISEYANLGAVVAYVAIVDHDMGRNGDVTCNMSPDTFQLQRYDLNEYKVVLGVVLDRERDSFHTVTIDCTDQGNPPLSTTRIFEVSVLDENDNAPKFYQQRYFTVIDENNEVGEELATVSAYDIDTGNNSQLVYTIAPLSAEYAYVNPNTGVVMANKRFDKEDKEGTGLSLTIYATDQGMPKLTATTTVLVSIKDVNDHRPVFVQSQFTFRISENRPSGSYVGQIKANDRDIGLHANTEYSLSNVVDNVPFVIFPDGRIQTIGEVDRELNSEYAFQVIAVDSENAFLNSTATVRVLIEDVNDNAPVIHSPTPGNDTVYLSSPMRTDSLVYKVTATDKDEPYSNNSNLIYSISSLNTTNLFLIDSATGEIFLSALLANADLTNQVFTLIIEVRDNGQRPQSVTTTLHVVITANNITDLAVKDTEYKKNVLIVVAVATVTFIISVAILGTIFIIRRLDIKRNNARLNMLSENMYYRGGDKVEHISQSSIDVIYADNTKKEVSFITDDDKAQSGPAHKKFNSFEHILLEPPVFDKYDGRTSRLDDSHSDRSQDSIGDSGKGGSDEDAQQENFIATHCDKRPKEIIKVSAPHSMAAESIYRPTLIEHVQEPTTSSHRHSFHKQSQLTTNSNPLYYMDDQFTVGSYHISRQSPIVDMLQRTARNGTLSAEIKQGDTMLDIDV